MINSSTSDSSPALTGVGYTYTYPYAEHPRCECHDCVQKRWAMHTAMQGQTQSSWVNPSWGGDACGVDKHHGI